MDLGRIIGFEWDEGNIDKSFQKHGVTPNEAEEVFTDRKLLVVRDVKHSRKELRYHALGTTKQAKVLFTVFTVRMNKIRIISTRPASRQERRQYEKT